MVLALDLLLVVVPAFSAFLGGAAGVLLLSQRLRRSPQRAVQLEKAFDPIGKHYHAFDRTARPPQKAGYYCECGQRAPESKQPAPWRLKDGR